MVKYELKKILGSLGGKIALALFGALVAVLCYWRIYDQWNISWYVGGNNYIHGPLAAANIWNAEKDWAGVLDQEMLQKALKFIKETEDYNDKVGAGKIRTLLNYSYQKNWKYDPRDFYNAEKVEPEQLPEFYDNRIKHLKQYLYDESDAYNNGYYKYTEAQKEYLIARQEAVKTPFRIDYYLGWRQAMMAVSNLGFFGVFLLGFFMAGIFANERRWKADAVYFSTLHGRKAAAKAKIKAAFLLTTVLYWFAAILITLVILGVLGFEGWNCPVQLEDWSSIYNMTFLEEHLSIMATGYLCWLFVTAFTLLISACSRSAVVPVLVPSLIAFVPQYLRGNDMLLDFTMLTPNALFFPFIRTRDMPLYTVFGRVVTHIPILLTLYITLTVLFTWLAYRAFSRKLLR